MIKNYLDMRHIKLTETYKLLSRLIWIDPEGKKWMVKKGFISDGHSIPWLLRSIAGSPFATKYPQSAWFHDYWLKFDIIPRREADLKYKLIMKDEGASGFQQVRNYIGVRIGSIFGGIVGWLRK